MQTHKELMQWLNTAQQATILARSMAAEMDAELSAVRARFEGKIKTRTDEAAAAIQAARVYAEANRSELLKTGGKSVKLNGHTLGWRDTPGAIKCVKGTTEKKLLERLMRETQMRRLFVRTKPTLNKESMLNLWGLFKKKLTALGARLVMEENFFVELDVTPDATPKN